MKPQEERPCQRKSRVIPSPSCSINLNIKRPADVRSFQHQSTSGLESSRIYSTHSISRCGNGEISSRRVQLLSFKRSSFQAFQGSRFTQARESERNLTTKRRGPSARRPNATWQPSEEFAQPRTSLARRATVVRLSCADNEAENQPGCL